MPHAHTWELINSALRRYRCSSCGVIGVARLGRRGIVAYTCQKEIDASRTHCGQPAVYVTALRTQSRCAEHAPAETKIAS